MNRKQLLISIAVLAVLCPIVFNLLKKDSSSWNNEKYSAGGENIFGDLDVNVIGKLTVTNGDEVSNIVRNETGWTVSEKGNYPADFKKISSLLGMLAYAKSVQDVKASKSQLQKLSLADDDMAKGNAVLVELSDESGKKTKSILLGKMHLKKEDNPNPLFGSEPDGRYVMILDGKFQPKLINYTFDDTVGSPISWTDKSFIGIDRIKAVDVQKKSADGNWKLLKNTENETFNLSDLKEGEELDPGKTAPLSNLLKNVSFLDVIPVPANFAGDTVIIETFDGFTYEITFAAQEKDTYSVNIKTTAKIPPQRESVKDEKPEDKDKLDREFKTKADTMKEKLEREAAFNKWVYTLNKNNLDTLLKSKKELLKEKKEETAPVK